MTFLTFRFNRIIFKSIKGTLVTENYYTICTTQIYSYKNATAKIIAMIHIGIYIYKITGKNIACNEVALRGITVFAISRAAGIIFPGRDIVSRRLSLRTIRKLSSGAESAE